MLKWACTENAVQLDLDVSFLWTLVEELEARTKQKREWPTATASVHANNKICVSERVAAISFPFWDPTFLSSSFTHPQVNPKEFNALSSKWQARCESHCTVDWARHGRLKGQSVGRETVWQCRQGQGPVRSNCRSVGLK